MKAENSLAMAEIYETIVDVIDDHVLVCDTAGEIVYANKAMQTYLGYRDSELKQKSIFDLIAGVQTNQLKSFLDKRSEEHPGREDFLFLGRNDVVKLHLRCLHKSNLIFIYGNEKYAEYDRLKRKLDVEIANAVKIHKRSLPEALPDTENIAFASLYVPAEELGGDLYDAFQVDNGLLKDYFEQYVCFVADVSGHGLDSAMLAIFVKDTIRSYFRLKHIPGQILSPKEIMHFFIDQYRKEGYPEEYLVCLFITVFDLRTMELAYCNAGLHVCPLLSTDKENIISLCNAGMPISTAINASWLQYEDTTLPLLPEMTLFLMSDGLPEQRVNGEAYEGRLNKLLPEICHFKPADIVSKIHEDFTDFLSYEKMKDDITLVVVKLTDK
jgi:sigma-B regulation protein RsbU (phosphoserine phosphatase)